MLYLSAVNAQITQTLRGNIVDKDDRQPLEGVSVAVFTHDNKLLKGVLTDKDGNFIIQEVPVGRVNVVASYVGYKKAFLPNTLVSSAKEVILNIEMESSIETLKEVEVAATRKGETINEMAVISARAFNVEETERYAGSRGDPARMASNFAGVTGSDDSRNDIVVRGNSPFGVQYRVENVHIPNPNHFNIPGSAGGSVAILNNRMLSTSDFLTGAFPAEFGNALAGVFDIRMKKGNNSRNEVTAEIGLLGANIFSEGPFNRKRKASYIFNYRYATLELMNLMGLDIGTEAIPRYTDLQFKINVPTRNGGNLSVFGIGGYSAINLLTSKQKSVDSERDIYASGGRDEYFQSGMGVTGLNYTRPVARNAFA
ncbi:MAG: carboxypeptidase-like regulatory domain-containing protein, partial [Chitinophagales bacterium]|nr:carboxypeptidase-like regulatory domain-containing protein [Chitinophagales bacterium]